MGEYNCMTYHYRPSGVCAKEIIIDLNEQGIIERVEFINGCPGNLIGIGKLVQGQKAEDVIRLLRGVTCGSKRTSCPDQLTYALEEALANS